MPATRGAFSAEYIQKITRKRIGEIKLARSLSILAEPVSQLGVVFDKVDKTSYYQAWIRADAKVTFTLQKGKAVVYCGEATSYSADATEQERCALRGLVRSILEDPEKLNAIKAVCKILDSPRIQLLTEACQIASQIALDMKVAEPDDDIYEAGIKLIGYYADHPELIGDLLRTASPRMIPSAGNYAAPQAG